MAKEFILKSKDSKNKDDKHGKRERNIVFVFQTSQEVKPKK